MLVNILFFVLCPFLSAFSATEKTTNWTPCNRTESDSQFNECLRSIIESVIQNPVKGKEDNEFMSFDPMLVNSIHLGGHNSINIRLRGISNTKIGALMMDVDKCKLYAETITPYIVTEGEFASPSGTSVVSIDDEKTKNSTIENVKVVHIVDCEKYEKEQLEFLRITKYNVVMKPDIASMRLTKLLDVYGETKKDYGLGSKLTKHFKKSGLLGNEYGRIFTNIANGKLSKFPVNSLFT